MINMIDFILLSVFYTMFYVHICLCMLIVIVMFVLLPAWRIKLLHRNCSSHVRTKDQIEATGAYDRDQFVPAPQTKFSQFRSSGISYYFNSVSLNRHSDSTFVKILTPVTSGVNMEQFCLIF